LKLLSSVAVLVALVFAPYCLWAEPAEVNSPDQIETSPADEEEGGWFGTAMLGGGGSHGNFSLLDAGESNKKISSLEDTEKKETKGNPLFNVEVGYLFDETGTWVSMNVMDNLSELDTSVIGNLSVGQSLGDLGTLAFQFTRSRNDVWEDPYLVGVDRKTTKATELTLGLSYEDLMGLPVSVGMEYTKVKVKNDVAGKRDSDLARYGHVYGTTLTFPLYFGEVNSVMAGVGYTKGDFDGESNSYDGYSVNLMHRFEMGRWSLSSMLMAGERRFGATHPAFGKTRDETDWFFSTEYTYNAPFGYDDFFVQVQGSVGETDANIAFFESSTMMIGAGVGYNF